MTVSDIEIGILAISIEYGAPFLTVRVRCRIVVGNYSTSVYKAPVRWLNESHIIYENVGRRIANYRIMRILPEVLALECSSPGWVVGVLLWKVQLID